MQMRAIRRRHLFTTSIASATAACVVVGALAPSAFAADPERATSAALRTMSPSAAAQPYAPPIPRAARTTEEANARISSLLPQRTTYKAVGGNYAGDVVDVETGSRLWNYRETTGLLPASNMKIVTAIAALRAMSPTTRFETKVVSLGKGTIAIVGGGDSTLSRTGLKTLAKSTASAIKSNPELLPDVTTPAPYRPTSCLRKGKWKKSTARKPCPMVTPPAGRYLKVFVDDSLYPAPTRPAGWRNGYEPSVVRPVRALGINGSYTWDSSAEAATYFSQRLGKRGFKTSYAGRSSTTEAPLIASYQGAPLKDQVSYMLQVSENNVAEMLYRNTAIARGYVATWANSKKAAGEILAELDIPLTGTNLTSGSGVSRKDRLTPISLTTMLLRVADSTTYPELSSIYYGGGLPLAGRSGTLSAGTGRYTTKPTRCAAGRLRAKTGTLHDTIGLSGLAVGSDGKLKAFSFLVNSRPKSFSPLATRRSVDRMAATLTGCF